MNKPNAFCRRCRSHPAAFCLPRGGIEQEGVSFPQRNNVRESAAQAYSHSSEVGKRNPSLEIRWRVFSYEIGLTVRVHPPLLPRVSSKVGGGARGVARTSRRNGSMLTCRKGVITWSRKVSRDPANICVCTVSCSQLSC